MAQWQDLQRLDSALQSRVSQLYERKLPREIRQYLCDWIESQDWDAAAVDENEASTRFHALLMYLEEQWNCCVKENNILQGPDFLRMKDYLVKHFQDNPLNLALLLSECLEEEKKILASATEAQGRSNPGTEQTWRQLDNKVNDLKRQTSEVKNRVNTLEGQNEKLDFLQKKWKSKVEQHIGLSQSLSVVEDECFMHVIKQTKQHLLEQVDKILNQASQIVTTLTDVELPQWKSRQQMACIGSPADTCLDHLQNWFTAVAEVLLGVREQLQKLQDQSNKYSDTDSSSLAASVAEIEKSALSLFTKLITNALLVEKQPVTQNSPQRPLIIKTRVRFKVTVRFLANLPEFKCRLKVKPVFDKEDAQTVSGYRVFDFDRDDSKVLDMDTPGGGLRAEFANMSLQERQARPKGSCESLSVTEELHIIRFVTVFQHAGLTCNIEASSLPVVVISSTSQVSSAWASVMWWNMLSISKPWDLSLFVDPPPLTWQQLSQVLSWQFLTVGQRELDENQLAMLRDKFVDDPDDLVPWRKFSKDESAWIWIDGILDLVKKHLVDLWRDGFIMGFVSRERTRFLLQNKEPGTFLLRFSESNKDGAISFSWVEHSGGEPHVHAVEPYTKKELLVMSLPDIIYHYSLTAQGKTKNPLVYLYPNIHKDAAFGRYYKLSEISATKRDINGYVYRRLASISINPTPPPSPPSESHMMEIDNDMDASTELRHLMDEFFADLHDLPELDVFWTSYHQTSHLHPLSAQDNITDFTFSP